MRPKAIPEALAPMVCSDPIAHAWFMRYLNTPELTLEETLIGLALSLHEEKQRLFGLALECAQWHGGPTRVVPK